jgi:hypothetical protein
LFAEAYLIVTVDHAIDIDGPVFLHAIAVEQYRLDNRIVENACLAGKIKAGICF